MADPRTRFRDRKFLSLTSFKRDGGAVTTPMWFVLDGDRLIVRTRSRSYKVKRMSRNQRVEVAPSDVRGERIADPVVGEANRVPGAEEKRLARLFRRKYPFAYRGEAWLLGPLLNAASKIGLGPGSGSAIFYELTLVAQPAAAPQTTRMPAGGVKGRPHVPARVRVIALAAIGALMALMAASLIEI